jgi:hypothetical protein
VIPPQLLTAMNYYIVLLYTLNLLMGSSSSQCCLRKYNTDEVWQDMSLLLSLVYPRNNNALPTLSWFTQKYPGRSIVSSNYIKCAFANASLYSSSFNLPVYLSFSKSSLMPLCILANFYFTSVAVSIFPYPGKGSVFMMQNHEGWYASFIFGSLLQTFTTLRQYDSINASKSAYLYKYFDVTYILKPSQNVLLPISVTLQALTLKSSAPMCFILCSSAILRLILS